MYVSTRGAHPMRPSGPPTIWGCCSRWNWEADIRRKCAAFGVTVGYVLGFAVQSGAVSRAGVTLSSFHTLIMQNKDVRNITTLCIATGVVPFAALGAVAGTRLAGKRKSSA